MKKTVAATLKFLEVCLEKILLYILKKLYSKQINIKTKNSYIKKAVKAVSFAKNYLEKILLYILKSLRAKQMNIKNGSMKKTAAVSLHFSKDYLEKILPKAILKSETIESIFKEADDVLECDPKLYSYIKKICFTNLDSSFSTPEPSPEVIEIVSKALYYNKRFWVEYQSMNINYQKTYFVNPLALVYCSNVPYLICTLFDGDKAIYLALHRMSNPRIAPVEAHTPPGFNLDDYTKSGVFKIDAHDSPITIKAILSGSAAAYFKERKDSSIKLNSIHNNQFELEVEVCDSLDIRQILRGFGDQIQILEPDYLRDEIHKASLHDALTGLLNRGEFDFRIEYEIKRHTRYKERFGLLLLDIDYFKKINDTYGHPDGDEVLKELAKRIQNSVREGDYCFRYGGEEFAVILVNADLKESIEVAERIRLAVCNAHFSLPNSKSQKNITVSIGISDFPRYVTKDLLKKRADKMLYKAKKKGRNCVKYWCANCKIK